MWVVGCYFVGGLSIFDCQRLRPVAAWLSGVVGSCW